VSYYVGILDGAKDVWGVRIPDVPGCYGGGGTPEAAIADATSALREVAAHWATKGVGLKTPRSMQEVLGDDASGFDPAAGESLVMIPLLLDQARPVKANISLDAGLLEVIDEEAKLHGLTRSSYLASAARDKIVGRPPGLYAPRDHKGRIKIKFKDSDEVGRSLTQDRRGKFGRDVRLPKPARRKERKPGA
jgi:predicted RNase H-like HicB family nuclease